MNDAVDGDTYGCGDEWRIPDGSLGFGHKDKRGKGPSWGANLKVSHSTSSTSGLAVELPSNFHELDAETQTAYKARVEAIVRARVADLTSESTNTAPTEDKLEGSDLKALNSGTMKAETLFDKLGPGVSLVEPPPTVFLEPLVAPSRSSIESPLDKVPKMKMSSVAAPTAPSWSLRDSRRVSKSAVNWARCWLGPGAHGTAKNRHRYSCVSMTCPAGLDALNAILTTEFFRSTTKQPPQIKQRPFKILRH